ncbi:MAG: RuBisCO large subunit C-terminal-like domain-containing protein [Thermoanaerobaculia bacterium]
MPPATEPIDTDSLVVDYRLTISARESARSKARAIAREQTVEIPEKVADPAVEERMIGRVVRVRKLSARHAEASIAYPWRELVSDLPQLLNLLFGNISMQRGIRLERVRWPEALVARFPGPRFGVRGLRDRLGVADRPLLATSLKPVGLSPAELGRLAAECVLGGIDVLKDDHSLADQPAAPFRERVFAIAEAVRAANRASGRRSIYVPNLTGTIEGLSERVEDLKEAGVGAAMIAPLLVGFDTVRWLAESSDLLLVGHSAFSGAYLGRSHGLAPSLLWGDLFRLAGCDVVVYPNAGGRFPISSRDCREVQERLLGPLGEMAASLAMVGGGIDAARLARYRASYSADTIFLVGGALYRGGRMRERATELRELLSARTERG